MPSRRPAPMSRRGSWCPPTGSGIGTGPCCRSSWRPCGRWTRSSLQSNRGWTRSSSNDGDLVVGVEAQDRQRGLAGGVQHGSGSPSSANSGGSTSTVKVRSGEWRAASSATASSRSAAGKRRRCRSVAPDSRRLRSSSCATNRWSRSVWASIVRIRAGSAVTTPSSRFSNVARSAEMGVRSSWDTLATRSRRCRSTSRRLAR